MATIVGEVTNLDGVVRAIDPVTQEVRVLENGGSVFANEKIITADGSNVVINLSNGDVLTLGRNSEIQLDEEVTGVLDGQASADMLADIEALQQAILEGDINNLEETAAGGEGVPGSASQGGVTIERAGAEGSVDSGYWTTTEAARAEFGGGLDEPDFLDTSPKIFIADTDGARSPADNSVVEATGGTVTGSVTIVAPEGVASITIAGQDVTQASTTPVVIPGTEGTLVVTGYDPTTGTITYNYTETNDADTHNALNNNVIDQFEVVLTDGNGVSASDILDIQILDTAPLANADQQSIIENAVSVNGNVMTNDTIGADATTVSAISGGTVGTAFATNYGSLVVNADGTYTYTLDNANPVVQALNNGQNLTETFVYTLSDADGDTSSTSFTLTINGVSDDVPTIIVGTNPSVVEATNAIVTGTMTVVADAGVDVVTVGGVNVTNATAENPVVVGGVEGILTVTGFNAQTGILSYSYQEQDGADIHNAANDNVFDSYIVNVTDTLGQTAEPQTLKITIEDTAPVANADSRQIHEDDVGIIGNVVTGVNATADTIGADVTAVVGVQAGNAGAVAITSGVGSVIAGVYGDLVLDATGGYSYVPNAAAQALDDGENPSDIFSYTVRDADGDFSTTTLTFSITGQTDSEPKILLTEGSVTSVVEATANTILGSYQIQADYGVQSITVDGQNVMNASATPVVITTNEGALTITGYDAITGILTYSYTEDGLAENHSAGAVIDSFILVVTDTTNQVTTENIDITIEDTAPTANDDVNTISENSLFVAGNVINPNDVIGADATSLVRIQGQSTETVTNGLGLTTVNGRYGVLTIDVNGNYNYVLDNTNSTVHGLLTGDQIADVFTYHLLDADGDADTATLTITIDGLTDRPPVITTATTTHEVVEATGDVINGMVSFFADMGVTAVTVNGVNVMTASASNPITVGGNEGTLVVTGYDAVAGTFTYQYKEDGDADIHDNAQNDLNVFDQFEVRVTDSINQTTTETFTVQILDTAPVAVEDLETIHEDSPGVSGNVITLGTGKDELGADDVTRVTSVSGVAAGTVGAVVAGAYGSLVLSADGSYIYHLNSNTRAVQILNDGESVIDTFDYTITDADGDSSSTTLTIVIEGRTDAPPVITVDNTAEIVEATAATITGFATVFAEAGIETVTVDGHDVTDANNQAIVIVGREGTLTITGYDAATGVISYSYKEDGDAEMHDNAQLDRNIFDEFVIQVTDITDQVTEQALKVTILDTQPDAIDDLDEITEGENQIFGNVITGFSTLNNGADILGADAVFISQVDSITNLDPVTGEGPQNKTVSGGTGTMIDGKYGTLIINDDGSYRYDLDNMHSHVTDLMEGQSLEEVFEYTLSDADGDSDKAELKFVIHGVDGSFPIIDIKNMPCKFLNADMGVSEGLNYISGEIVVRAEGGLNTVTITDSAGNLRDVTLAKNGIPVTITGERGILIIEGYDAGVVDADGYSATINYRYMTFDAQDHSLGEDSIQEHFTVRVTDDTGREQTDELDIQIVDTAPEAVNDDLSIVEDTAAITGNVITDNNGNGKDVIGADVTKITAVTGLTVGLVGSEIAGKYGTLVLNANGDYAYTLDNENRLVQLLDDGETAVDTFTYTLTDADGDVSTATINVTVQGTNDTPLISDEIAITSNKGIAGLFGEYYSYKLASWNGTGGNHDGNSITNIATAQNFIATNTSDATFIAEKLFYTEGSGRLAGDQDTSDGLTNLEKFLGSDAASLSVDDPTLAHEAVLHMHGNIELAAGEYNFKITADNGYLILIDGVKVAENFVTRHWSGANITQEHASFTIAESGQHNIEIIYVDNNVGVTSYVFEPQLRLVNGDYERLSSFNLTHDVPTVTGNLIDNIQRGGTIDSIVHNGVEYTAADHPNGVNISTVGGGVLALSFVTGVYTYTGTAAANDLFTVNATDSEANQVNFNFSVTTTGMTVSQVETFNFSNEGWTTDNVGADTQDRALLLETGHHSAEKVYQVDANEEVSFKFDFMTVGKWDTGHQADNFQVFVNGQQVYTHTGDISEVVAINAVADANGEVAVRIESHTNAGGEVLHVENVELVRTVNIDNILYADDNRIETFNIADGQDVTIVNFDHVVDTLDINEMLDGVVVTSQSLNEYLCFDFDGADSDGDGKNDVSMIAIDADGDARTQDDITRIYLENSRFDEDDLSDLNIDYQNQ